MKTVLSFLSLLLLADAAGAATLAPHRALYDLTLLRAEEGASIQSATGKMALEYDGSACEGYTTNFRMATKYRQDEGNVIVIDTMDTTFESPGATELRRKAKETVDGKLRDSDNVKMTRATPDSEGTAKPVGGSGEPFTVPAGALLPMQHQLRLLALAQSGGGRDSSVVFDGSDGNKSFRAISFIGARKAPGSIVRDAGSTAAAPLKGLAAWPMTVSYYALDGSSETPEYQVSFDMYENGVATGVVLDYGDFALSGTLTDLKLLDNPGCP